MKKEQIRQGDNIQLVAQRVLGDAEYWQILADYNKLEYPYIIDFDEEEIYKDKRVLKIGDIILIPTEDEDLYQDSTKFSFEDDPSLGIDLVLTSDKFNMSFGTQGEVISNDIGDVTVVSGYKCLAQDLIHELITPKGTLLFHPEYGSTFLELIGNKKVSENIHKAVIELTRVFNKDIRVSSVENVTVEVLIEGIHIDCVVICQNGNSFTINETIRNGVNTDA